jgi:hypothetical protein
MIAERVISPLLQQDGESEAVARRRLHARGARRVDLSRETRSFVTVDAVVV